MGVTQSEAIQNHCQLNWSSEGCNGIPEFILYCRQLFLYNVGVVNRKKKKEFKYQTARKGRHKERVAKQEKTQPLNQTVNEKNECLPHQKSYCCFWLFGSDHQESTFFFFLCQSENKHSNNVSRGHVLPQSVTVATPVKLSYRGRVVQALFETSAPRFQTNARFSFAFTSWRDGTAASRCHFFLIFSSCPDLKKKTKKNDNHGKEEEV